MMVWTKELETWLLVTRPLSLPVRAVINRQIDLGDVTGMNSVRRLGDVTETNRTQVPKQQTAVNWINRAGTRQETWKSIFRKSALARLTVYIYGKISKHRLEAVNNRTIIRVTEYHDELKT